MIVVSIALAGCASPSSEVAVAVDAVYAQAEGVSPERADAGMRRDVAVLEWAIELGLEQPLTRGDIEEAYETGGAQSNPYGARGLTLWQYYQERVEEAAQLIRSELIAELSEDEVRAHYEQNQAAFARQDIIVIEVTEWEENRALSPYQVTIDADTVRTLQERDDEIIGAALELASGEQATVQRRDGRYAQVLCLSRDDGGVEPFDDVVQAAAARLADERFEAEVQRRAAALGDDLTAQMEEAP